MTSVTEQQILEALQGVNDPERGNNVVDLGMITGMQIKDGHVAFAIQVDPERGPHMEPLRKEAESTVHGLPGVISVTAVLTAERPQEGGPAGQVEMENAMLPEVASIVAVASGKGGVGKSTTAVNLAIALRDKGLKVGVLDADIYGPSMPRMLGITGDPTSADGRRMDPMENHGIKCMSMGFLVEEETPIIWRGPMVMGALEQFMRDVDWGPLDVLVVDMPPGTGDVQLTMAQRVPLTGAVIVSTPQDIALADARKGLNMFRKVDVAVLGLVENMSYFACPHCGERTEIFSHGGAKDEADLLGMPFLGEVPLDVQIRETSDGGNPIVDSDPDNAHSKAYREIADKVWANVEQQLAKKAAQAPKIVLQ
ncbi:Mrp/NBP35 family ATP-binding protein [Magnetospira sp. QH-2]|uniref:Mrp/NBP35 family ATP-binding protein n=1 Tax=Magnetospira sp. (strain QH-2) TaxID=1288970 RepID=UPI0003E80D5F|nr:Mrp/NBP35 family ATP-binding protein [Magnetospira sp. QH-2]CCQ73481.1 Putative ATPase of the MinD/MRP superfamily (mrp-like)(ATP/GTP-binding protein) [Magnetospira sp. QH-2]